MRILIATHSIDWGGSARSLLILLRRLAARHGCEVVSLLPPHPNRAMAAAYASLGVPVHVFPWGWLPVSYMACAVPEEEQDRRRDAMRARTGEFAALARRADIIIFNGYPALSLAEPAPAGIPKALIAREVLDERSPRITEVRSFIRAHVTRAAAIGVREAGQLADMGVPHRIIFNTAEEAPRFLPLPGRRPLRFAYFGQMAASKGVLDLAEAAATAAPILRARGAEVHLHGGGGDRPAPAERRIREGVEAMGLGDVIRLHPWTDDAAGALGSCHCLVRPDPTGSPWGRDIIEAMSFGRAVLATGDETMFVKPGETGRLVPPGRPEALAAALGALARSPEALEDMGRRAFAFARRHFNPETILPRLESWLLHGEDSQEG